MTAQGSTLLQNFLGNSVALKVLNVFLVLFCGRHGLKCSQVASLAGFGIFFARVEAIFAGLEFADHGWWDAGPMFECLLVDIERFLF